jgi:uncharacterized protein
MSKPSGLLAAALLAASVCTSSLQAAGDPPAVQTAEKAFPGIWLGTLKVGIGLRLAFTVKAKPDGTFSATLNSLDQMPAELPLDQATLKEKSVHFEWKAQRIAFDGTLNEAGTEIAGKFKQSGLALTLLLKKVDRLPETHKRPQEPKPPFPYRAIDVKFENKAGHSKLAGTLTIPRTPSRPPAVVLITGSGQQDRDEAIAGHRPFYVLADYLSRHGIAVLRVDDRGVGGSTGDVAHSTSEDFAGDVIAALDYLRTRSDIDVHKLGLMGHSEGGEIAPMVANRTPDVAFIILLAGPGLPGDQIVLLQLTAILKEGGVPDALIDKLRAFQEKLYAAVKAESDGPTLTKKINALYTEFAATLSDTEKKMSGISPEAGSTAAKMLGSPWFRFFLTYDPRPALTRVKCPVLALVGEKDIQVPAKQNVPELEKALRAGGNKDFTVREMPHLNHLFQTCKSGSVMEYSKIDETFSPSALALIAQWINEHTSGSGTAQNR